MLKDILQGKTVRHPLHPFLVHFPIGLFILSFLLDMGRSFWPEISGLPEGAFYSMAAGLIAALVAAVPGFVDYVDLRRDHPARKIAIAHMLLNLIVVAIYAANVGIRKFQPQSVSTSFTPILLSTAGIVVLSVSGHLGGKLVFDNGISIGRHRRKSRLPDHTIVASASAPANAQDDYLRVASDSDLSDGETLRVEVNGTILVLARSNGNLFAFQEFCTHRFGPLSEGCILEHEIECPWHRSRFDMQTGKVTSGPAKTNLKCFEVVVRNGAIFVSRHSRPEADLDPGI
jgi:nitrite reductase/ring-hydroxylating ferredoxin subunit/uncharacterized membrane protein